MDISNDKTACIPIVVDEKPKAVVGGKYELDVVIGSGSFANIWRAKDLTDNKLVAVKSYKKIDSSNIEEYLNEVKILTAIHNTNVAPKDCVSADNVMKLYGVDVNFNSINIQDSTDLRCSIFTNYGSCNLEDLLDKVPHNFPTGKYFNILDQIYKGLEYIHSRGFVHSDIKPDNVIVNESIDEILGGKAPTVFICDFNTAFKDNGNVYGADNGHTASYAAPEVLLDGKVNKDIDIWSLGCIAGRMFNGDDIFPGDNDTSTRKITTKTGTYFDYHILKTNFVLVTIFEFLGPLPKELYDGCRLAKLYFNEEGDPRYGSLDHSADEKKAVLKDIFKDHSPVDLGKKVDYVLKCLRYTDRGFAPKHKKKPAKPPKLSRPK